MSSSSIQENIYSINISNVFVDIRKRKRSIKKTKSNDRRVKNQLKLVHKIEKSNDNNKIGHESKRSLRVNSKTLTKTPFKTTNLGRKRINAKRLSEKCLTHEERETNK